MPNTLYLSPDLDSALRHAAQAGTESRRTRPFAPITLLLPGSEALHALRQSLGDGIGIRLQQFYGLGQTLLAAAGVPVQRISDTAVRRLARSVLSQMARAGELSTFLPVWDTPGFTRVMLDWLREMKSRAIPPEAVAAHAAGSGQERDRQLAGFYRAYQEFMRQHNCSDADGLLWLAAEALETPARTFPRQQLFIAIGFDQFSPLQLRILRALQPHCADFRIYLPWDAQRPPTSLALTRLALTRQQLESALAPEVQPLEAAGLSSPRLRQVRSSVFEPAPAPAPSPSDPLRLVAAPSREAEVRWALKAVKRLLLGGTPPEQIALLVPQPGTYRRILEVAAAEYGLPIQVDHALRDIPAIAALLNLTNLAPDFPWRETLDALRSPYIRQPWLSEEQIGQLDQLSRERPVLAGREQWRFALQPLIHPAEGEEEEDNRHSLAAHLTPAQLASIENGLTAFFDHITPPEPASYRDHTLWLQQAILGLFPDPEEELADQPPLPPSLQMLDCCQPRDLQALELLLQSLRSLVEAADLITPTAEASCAWADFRAELARILPNRSLAPDPLQVGVRFAALETGRSTVVDHLFVLGLAEGEFPRPPAVDVLYAPRERAAHPLPLERSLPGEQASLWWQVLGSCRSSLTLLRPYLDEKGAPWPPSSYWTATLEAAQPQPPELHLPIAAQLTLEDSASPAELLLALVNRAARSVPAAIAPAWHASQAAYQLMRQRQSWLPLPAHEGLLEDAGLLDELGQQYGPSHTWSASRLNNYGSCPYAFFAQNILELKARGDPQEDFDAMQRGTLLHAILEALFRQLSAQNLALSPANLPAIESILADCCGPIFAHAPRRYGFRPGPLWVHQQSELRRMVCVLLRKECSEPFSSSEYRPYQQELRFGFPHAALPRLTASSPSGFSFTLRGMIDRVDRAESSLLRLFDYKSGTTKYTPSDIRAGTAFQSPLYALAVEQLMTDARVAESAYLHIPARETSGRLAFSGSVATDEMVTTALETAAAFIQNIRAGQFPVLPARALTGQHSCASSCDFSALCRVSRHTAAKARRGTNP